MYSIVQKRKWFYLFSTIVIVPGILIMLYSLVTTGSLFRLSNQFVGGSQYELQFTTSGATEANIRDAFVANGNSDISIQRVGAEADNHWTVRGAYQDQPTQAKIIA